MGAVKMRVNVKDLKLLEDAESVAKKEKKKQSSARAPVSYTHLYVGQSVFTSNSHDALTTSSVSMAYAFSSA